jgi:probable F420-dependent oxidoreductase
MTEVAGEVADGLLVHPFNSRRFMSDSLLPALERGLARGGRKRSDYEVACQVLLVIGDSTGERRDSATPIRQQLAFYGSTPAYRPVLEAHGWGELQDELHALSKRGGWVEMGERITDEMLETFAVCGSLEELPGKLRVRYGDQADRLALVSYAGLERTQRDRWMKMLIEIRRASTRGDS